MKSLLAELRRRHVFRVAAWYAVAAWLVIQIAVNVFPHLLLPDWSIRLVVVLCLIGFPIAIALAWALEVTPEGVKVTEPTEVRPPISAGSPWRGASLWLALAGGVLLGVGAMQAWHSLGPLVNDAASPKVLAVLPFENLGGDEANVAFTAGIHDTLITRIAKIGGMTVISRTSVMAYEGKRPNLRDVAKALGVTHVIEGSVQRSGEQVRIQAQLIDAATDTHLWAESYDRTMAEGFATQNEIATAIAKELSVRLTDQERAAFHTVPTQDAQAFEQYVLGHAAIIQSDNAKAITHFEMAVERDPGFALAFAELSIAYIGRALEGYSNADNLRTSAREAYEQALTLQPGSPEGLLARGVFSYRGLDDFAAAEPDLSAAIAQLPNNSQAYLWLGSMRRRQGRWQESAALLERVVAIEPDSTSHLWVLCQTYNALRNRAAQEHAIQRAQAANPGALAPAMWRAWLPMQYDGDLNGLVLALERLRGQISLDQLGQQPDDLSVLYNLNWAYHSQGRFHEAAALLEAIPDEADFFPGMRDADIGWALRDAGDSQKAQRWLESALLKVENADLRKYAPSFSSLAWVVRAFALAGLGRADEAARLAREAVSQNPRSKDEIDWWLTTERAASLLAQIGDNGGAIELIQQLLDPPSVILPYELWFGWGLAPLRANPEFRELMARHGVDVTRDPRAQFLSQSQLPDQQK